MIDDGRPWDSALILSAGAGEDGFLKVSEAFGLDLRADLVVLSGCSTGRGKLSGDGILGLSRPSSMPARLRWSPASGT